MTVYKEKPKEFESLLDVVSCFIVHEGNLLLVQYSSYSPNEGKWVTPGGKVEKGEAIEDAAPRELFEETGIKETLQLVRTYYVERESLCYTLHLFYTTVEEKPEVILSHEHKGYKWHPLSGNDHDLNTFVGSGDIILDFIKNWNAGTV